MAIGHRRRPERRISSNVNEKPRWRSLRGLPGDSNTVEQVSAAAEAYTEPDTKSEGRCCMLPMFTVGCILPYGAIQTIFRIWQIRQSRLICTSRKCDITYKIDHTTPIVQESR